MHLRTISKMYSPQPALIYRLRKRRRKLLQHLKTRNTDIAFKPSRINNTNTAPNTENLSMIKQYGLWIVIQSFESANK